MGGRSFIVKHTVLFNETNAMGGVVYFSNFVKWQGMVRETFLMRVVPSWGELLKEAYKGNLNMITVEEHSKFLDHAFFGDEISIKIHAAELRNLSFKIIFEMTKNNSDKIIYLGWQKLAFHNKANQLIQAPRGLFEAVLEYTPEDEIRKFKAYMSNNEVLSG